METVEFKKNKLATFLIQQSYRYECVQKERIFPQDQSIEFDVGLSCCRDDTTRSRELPVGEQSAGHGCDRLCRAGTG